MYFYKEGYTEEEFEEVYGMKPYIEMEGQKLYRTDLIVFPNGNIDINFQLRRLQQALEDGEDTTHFFETEDERFAREQREEEERIARNLELHKLNLEYLEKMSEYNNK